MPQPFYDFSHAVITGRPFFFVVMRVDDEDVWCMIRIAEEAAGSELIQYLVEESLACFHRLSVLLVRHMANEEGGFQG